MKGSEHIIFIAVLWSRAFCAQLLKIPDNDRAAKRKLAVIVWSCSRETIGEWISLHYAKTGNDKLPLYSLYTAAQGAG